MEVEHQLVVRQDLCGRGWWGVFSQTRLTIELANEYSSVMARAAHSDGEMIRAAVLISVKKTGDLHELQATEKAAEDMRQWAEAQHFDIVKTISDDSQPVDPGRIKRAIKEIVIRANVDQLIVYFTGHGVNIRNGEYWLLSDAPTDTQAAVNVDGSIALARQSVIPHIVLISDACRTAAEGIRAQAVTGSEIFPNEGFTGQERSVDLFLACGLGMPAHEVKDVNASRGYSAVYTDVLVAALKGLHVNVVDQSTTGKKQMGYVRPWPLKRFLTAEVSRRFLARAVELGFSQIPDARITSEPAAWLSRIDLPKVRRPVPPATPPPEPPQTLLSVSQDALQRALEHPGSTVPRTAGPHFERELTPWFESVSRGAEPFGPTHFETRCGFKVQGARITDAFTKTAKAKLLSDSLVRVDGLTGWETPAANVLLATKAGTGVVLPAIADFLASLTFEDDELVNVTYEPADSSHRWFDYQSRAGELRTLRSLVASSARFGVFRLQGEDAPKIARRMQVAKGVDPTMALYAAYAYDSLNRRERLLEMESFMYDDLRLRLFDIALLTRRLESTRAGSVGEVFPFVPMLAQGWALLSAYRVRFPASLEHLQSHLRQSLWTLFDRKGTERIYGAMRSGEVR